MAGPGSGKTHVLTYRCAKLIRREHILPEHILVLAYNRAVVTELKNRLDKLFANIGMSSVAHRLHVHTFHEFARRSMGKQLDDIPTKCWEYAFWQYLSNPNSIIEFRGKYPQIEFILIDEFQDITQNRLAIIDRLQNIYPTATYFTIGDINQSIYGFDRRPKDCNRCGYWRTNIKLIKDPQCLYSPVTPKQYADSLNPQPYYDRLNAMLNPVQLGMFTNYRSYQKILNCSAKYVPKGYQLPVSADSLMKHEPQVDYTFITDCNDENLEKWKDDLNLYISKVQETNSRILLEENSYQRIRDIAVFFRTNNEVYRGYSLIKPFVPKDVRIRIQGASNCELWREREIYFLIHTLLSHPDTEIELRNVEKNTVQGIKKFIQQKMDDSPNWDRFYLDLVYTLVLNYVDSIRTDDVQHTWSELAEYIKDIAGNDDGGQVYKIYEQYRNERIIQEDPLTIILTTMHKVKGLEFDAVFITPSSANLPLKPHRVYNPGEPLAEDDLADIAEERRLLFVAYTRAKKYLHVYKGDRERAVDEWKIYIQPNQTAIYTEKEPSMDKYFLSYNAMEKCFQFNDYITKNVRKDDEIQLIEYRNYYYILHGTQYIGRLSNNSDIAKNARNNHIQKLRRFHVSDICVWTYEETIRADQSNNTTFGTLWCENAIRKGFVYLVQIAGFGEPY